MHGMDVNCYIRFSQNVSLIVIANIFRLYIFCVEKCMRPVCTLNNHFVYHNFISNFSPSPTTNLSWHFFIFHQFIISLQHSPLRLFNLDQSFRRPKDAWSLKEDEKNIRSELLSRLTVLTSGSTPSVSLSIYRYRITNICAKLECHVLSFQSIDRVHFIYPYRRASLTSNSET